MKEFKYLALTCVFIYLATGISLAQIEKNKLVLGVGYFNDNNQLQYLKANTKAKIDGRFTPVAGADLRFYISADSPDYIYSAGRQQIKMELAVTAHTTDCKKMHGINRPHKLSWLFLILHNYTMRLRQVLILPRPGSNWILRMIKK